MLVVGPGLSRLRGEAMLRMDGTIAGATPG